MKRTRTFSNAEQTCSNWRLLQLGLLLLVAALAWSSCKQKVAVIADVDPVGSYTLASVNGKQVPCTVTHEGASPTIKAGKFVINQDGTCSSKVSFSMPGGGDSSREVKATYKRDGSKLTMQWDGAGITTGTVEGDTFTMNNEGMVFAYRK
jgi:hypothetical protein